MIYSAISLRQPWANLIARGEKTIETRTWARDHRGDLVICSSLKGDPGFEKMEPAGMALCIVELYKIEPMTEEHEDAAYCDWEPGKFSWFLRNIRRVKPVPVKGRLGIYRLEIPGGLKVIGDS